MKRLALFLALSGGTVLSMRGHFDAAYAANAVNAANTTTAADAVTLRVMSFNVWYGGEQVSLVKVGEAIRAADADIVGVQEADGNLQRIAEVAGMPYVDPRRRIISRWPIFDSGSGERTERGPSPYSTTALDRDALHAWVMIRPGKVIAMANVHLSSDPSGLEVARTGSNLAEALAIEEKSRVMEARPLTALAKLAADGTPVFLTGDFNTPSHLDWTPAVQRVRADVPYPVEWPAMRLLADAGLRDSYREAHPDPARRAGITWTPGTPHPIPASSPGLDRIDFVLMAGRTKTTASQVVGEVNGPDVDIAIAPWPSDHRAIVSTFEVTPAAAPPLISVTPRRVQAGQNFLVRAHDPTGDRWTALIVPRGAGPEAALTGVKALPSSYQLAMPFSTQELAPGNYDALLVSANGKVLKRSAFTIAAPGSKPTITVIENTLRTGSPIRVRWRDTPGDLRDWIGLFAAGEVDVTRYLGFAYTEALFSGETVVEPEAPPLPPGNYELRLMHDETYVVLDTAAFKVVP